MSRYNTKRYLYSERETAALRGQSAMFNGAGVTVQVPLFGLGRADVALPERCEHPASQEQRTFVGTIEHTCTTCGAVLA
jgi:hypothetical protein